MKLIDGNKISDNILNEIKEKLESTNLWPNLSIINVGNNPASEVYVQKKIQAGKRIGINVTLHDFADISDLELKEIILALNSDAKVNGIIIQLPIKGKNYLEFTNLINPIKDVDGLNATNIGNLWHKNGFYLVSATALAIMKVFEVIAKDSNLESHEFLKGKHVLVINRSDLIGKPLLPLLLDNNATVTVAHSKTSNIEELLAISDIVITATGKQNLFSFDSLKKGAVVIDAGFTREKGNQHGDLEVNTLPADIAWLSPVPNGVGPIGVAMLLQNTFTAAKFQSSLG